MKKLIVLALFVLLAVGCEPAPVQDKSETEAWLDIQRTDKERAIIWEAEQAAGKARWCEKNKEDKYAQEMCKK